jgi:hypothetical protein
MIVKELCFIAGQLERIELLYNGGLRGNHHDIYSAIDSIANYVNAMNQRYSAKLNVNTKFAQLLKFSDVSIDVIRLNNKMNTPNQDEALGHYFFYEDANAKAILQSLFNKINQFIENELPTIKSNLNSVLDGFTFIDLDRCNVTIADEVILNIKKAILFKVKNKYDGLTTKTLQLYYYSVEEMSKGIADELLYDVSSSVEPVISYAEYLLEKLPIKKLIEIASDFNVNCENITVNINN